MYCGWRGITYHIDQLREPQTHLDRQTIGVVAHGSNEAIVVAQQVVVEALGIRVGQAAGGKVQCYEDSCEEHATHLRPGPTLL